MVTITAYESQGWGAPAAALVSYVSDTVPRVGEFVSFMSSDGVKHYQCLAVRHGIEGSRHTTAEIWVTGAQSSGPEIEADDLRATSLESSALGRAILAAIRLAQNE